MRELGVLAKTDGTLWRAFTQPESHNFLLEFLDQFDALETSLHRCAPALAATAERLAYTYLATTRSDIGRQAVVGAALGWSVFDEAIFWRSLEESVHSDE